MRKQNIAQTPVVTAMSWKNLKQKRLAANEGFLLRQNKTPEPGSGVLSEHSLFGGRTELDIHF